MENVKDYEDLKILLRKSYEGHYVELDHKDCKDILDVIGYLEKQITNLEQEIDDSRTADECDGTV